MPTIYVHGILGHLCAYEPAVQDEGDSLPKEREQNRRRLLQKIQQLYEDALWGNGAEILDKADHT
jgi:hypothetical protein